jgi:hypothetical protein
MLVLEVLIGAGTRKRTDWIQYLRKFKCAFKLCL